MADCGYASFELVIKCVMEVQKLGEWLRDGLSDVHCASTDEI
jgi:hypothetical protein